jgi:cytochrome P450
MDTPRRVIDFDHHSREYAEQVARNPTAYFQEMQTKNPVAWTNSHGGFWVVFRYEDVRRVAEDDATFSSRRDLPVGVSPFAGIVIPPSPGRTIPIEMDPPEFFDYRRMLNRRFAPAAVERLKPTMLEFTTWCIDQRIESGQIDLILDLASPVPAMMTLYVLGISLEHWPLYADIGHAVVYTPPSSPEHPKVVAGDLRMRAILREIIRERRRNPGESADLITHIAHAQIGGRPIPEAELVDICALIVHGGVDTTTSLIAHTFDYLESHPPERRRLTDNPGLIPSACEEFLRYYTPTQSLARTATRDVELGGQHIKAGDRVMMSWASANHDPAAFEHPEQIDLERFPNRHTGFGLGVHRCLGSNFARAQYTIVVEQAIKRMPDYRLNRGQAERYETFGTINGYVKMPATFTPGAPSGAPAPEGLAAVAAH